MGVWAQTTGTSALYYFMKVELEPPVSSVDIPLYRKALAGKAGLVLFGDLGWKLVPSQIYSKNGGFWALVTRIVQKECGNSEIRVSVIRASSVLQGHWKNRKN